MLICSANRREGATAKALGLALAEAAQQTEPVLLIGGNFHDPQVCGFFRMPE